MNANANQPRKPRGTPIGGQWTGFEHAGAQTTLTETPAPRSTLLADPDVERLLQERREQLQRDGFVPALRARAVVSPRSTAKIDDWWDNQMLTAEYSREGAVPQLPDDYGTNGSGNALSGKRRTSRMRYSTGGVDLRMPSRTAIGKFFNDTGATVVDVPVAAGAGDKDALQLWVRVTKHGPGSFSAKALDVGGTTELAISEAVSATLEGRTAAAPLRTYQDLLDRRRAREAASGIDPVQLESSWLTEVAYDDNAGVMYSAVGGREYGHRVPRAVYERVVTAASPGRVFNSSVKGNERVGIERCDDCGRFTVQESAHLCPATAPAPVPAEYNARAAAYLGLAPAAPVAAAPQPPAPVAPAPAAPAVSEGHVLVEDEQTVDLAAIWDEHAERPLKFRDTELYGPRGWSRKAAEILTPNASSTYAASHYGGLFDDGRRNDSDCVAIDGVDADRAVALIQALPADNLDDRQSETGPTVRSLLSAAIDHPGEVEVHGYLISPSRPDERVAIQGMRIFDEDLAERMPVRPTRPDDETDEAAISRYDEDTADYEDELESFLETVSSRYNLDEQDKPGWVSAREVPWRPGETAVYLCWD